MAEGKENWMTFENNVIAVTIDSRYIAVDGDVGENLSNFQVSCKET